MIIIMAARCVPLPNPMTFDVFQNVESFCASSKIQDDQILDEHDDDAFCRCALTALS